MRQTLRMVLACVPVFLLYCCGVCCGEEAKPSVSQVLDAWSKRAESLKSGEISWTIPSEGRNLFGRFESRWACRAHPSGRPITASLRFDGDSARYDSNSLSRFDYRRSPASDLNEVEYFRQVLYSGFSDRSVDYREAAAYTVLFSPSERRHVWHGSESEFPCCLRLPAAFDLAALAKFTKFNADSFDSDSGGPSSVLHRFLLAPPLLSIRPLLYDGRLSRANTALQIDPKRPSYKGRSCLVVRVHDVVNVKMPAIIQRDAGQAAYAAAKKALQHCCEKMDIELSEKSAQSIIVTALEQAVEQAVAEADARIEAISQERPDVGREQAAGARNAADSSRGKTPTAALKQAALAAALEAARQVVEGATIVNSQSEYWIDPSRDYAVLRYQETIGERPFVQVDIEYDRTADVGWMPKKWTVLRLGDTPSDVLQLVCAVRSDVAVGRPQEAAVWEPFPCRAYVKDLVEQQQYFVRDDREKLIVSDGQLETFTHDYLTARLNTAEHQRLSDRGWTARRVLARVFSWPLVLGPVAVVAGLLFAANYVLAHRRSRTVAADEP